MAGLDAIRPWQGNLRERTGGDYALLPEGPGGWAIVAEHMCMSNHPDAQGAGFTGPATEQGGVAGHVLVAACACVLTVAIVGSAAFLTYNIYSRLTLRSQVRSIVASLQNRTPDELAQKAAQVKDRPKVARVVLPEVLKSLRDSTSEQQQYSAIQILQVFVDHKRVEQALFQLRRDGRERVAAAAVRALTGLQPPQRAAAVLGRCLDDVKSHGVVAAVVDEACAGLYRLGPSGREEMQGRLSSLSVDRRIWLAGYVGSEGGPQRRAWLEMLRSDGDEKVRAAAERRLQAMVDETSAPA